MRLPVPGKFQPILRDCKPDELTNLKEDLANLRASGLGRERIIEKASEAGWDREFAAWYLDALNEYGRELEIEVSAPPVPPPHIEAPHATPPIATPSYQPPPPAQSADTKVDKQSNRKRTVWRSLDLVLGIFVFISGVLALIPAIQQPLDNATAMLLVIIPAFLSLSGLLVAFTGAVGHVLWVLFAVAAFGVMMLTADSPSSTNHAKGIPIYIMGAYGLGRLFPARRMAMGWILASVFGLAGIGIAAGLDASKRQETPESESLTVESLTTPLQEAQDHVDVLGNEITTMNIGTPKHVAVQRLVAWVKKEGDRQEREEAGMETNEFKRLFDTKLFVTSKGRQEIKAISSKFRQMVLAWDIKSSTEELNSIMVDLGVGPLLVKDEYIQSYQAMNTKFLKLLDIHDQMLNVVSAGRVTLGKKGNLLFHTNQIYKYENLLKQFEKGYEATLVDQARVEKAKPKLLNEVRSFVD